MMTTRCCLYRQLTLAEELIEPQATGIKKFRTGPNTGPIRQFAEVDTQLLDDAVHLVKHIQYAVVVQKVDTERHRHWFASGRAAS